MRRWRCRSCSTGPSLGPATVDAPVSHVDIAPTILDLIGLAPPESIDGQSLVRPPAGDRPLYFEALDASLTRGWAPLRGIVQGGWKYIDLPDAELYDLSADPGEQHNRIDRDPHAEPLKRALQLVSTQQTVAPQVALEPDAVGTPALARLYGRQFFAQRGDGCRRPQAARRAE